MKPAIALLTLVLGMTPAAVHAKLRGDTERREYDAEQSRLRQLKMDDNEGSTGVGATSGQSRAALTILQTPSPVNVPPSWSVPPAPSGQGQRPTSGQSGGTPGAGGGVGGQTGGTPGGGPSSGSSGSPGPGSKGHGSMKSMSKLSKSMSKLSKSMMGGGSSSPGTSGNGGVSGTGGGTTGSGYFATPSPVVCPPSWGCGGSPPPPAPTPTGQGQRPIASVGILAEPPTDLPLSSEGPRVCPSSYSIQWHQTLIEDEVTKFCETTADCASFAPPGGGTPCCMHPLCICGGDNAQKPNVQCTDDFFA